MPALDLLTPLDPRYPSRLRRLVGAPPSVTVAGGPLEAERTVAVVGTREPTAEALRFARELSAIAARAGAVVVSGGTLGIDAAAHEGALEAGGRTWAIAATGPDLCSPPGHAALFARIALGPGAMLWPFPPGYFNRVGFLVRNRILATLSDAVVVVQAGFPSGALSAAACAQRLSKPLWVVPAAPWMVDFEGSRRLLDGGARPLTSAAALLQALGLTAEPIAAHALPPEVAISACESNVLAAISVKPLHPDAIAAQAGESHGATTAALLTLALKDVVVEGPPGFFRRR